MEILEVFVDKSFLAKLKRCGLCASVWVTVSNCSILYLIQCLQNAFVALFVSKGFHVCSR